MNEWHNDSKQQINKKIMTFIVMLALGTCLLILLALVAAHLRFVFA